MYPVADLVQFSRDVGHEGKVQVVTCGVSSQMTEVKMALQEAMTTGNWLVIQNAHLAETWTKDMLQLLKVHHFIHMYLEFRPFMLNSNFITKMEKCKSDFLSGLSFSNNFCNL